MMQLTPVDLMKKTLLYGGCFPAWQDRDVCSCISYDIADSPFVFV